MRLRILVASESEARFFDLDAINAPLREVSQLEDEGARVQDKHLESDRPGRSFDRMAPGRHAMDGERSAQRQNQLRFAHRLADNIEKARQARAFDRLVILAGPRMLGLIREALPDPIRSSLAAEIPKDLAHLDAEALRDYIPREAFHGGQP